MPHDATTELAGETVTLLPERALYWPRQATLFVADLHWGKAAAFRAAGVPLPGGSTSADLDRLSGCVERSGARRLALLGDLIHARAGRAEATLAAIGAWRERHTALEVLLVRGNHDRHAGDPPAAWNIETVDAPHLEAPFVLRHHPEPSPEGYTLAGHLHPAVIMSGGWAAAPALAVLLVWRSRRRAASVWRLHWQRRGGTGSRRRRVRDCR